MQCIKSWARAKPFVLLAKLGAEEWRAPLLLWRRLWRAQIMLARFVAERSLRTAAFLVMILMIGTIITEGVSDVLGQPAPNAGDLGNRAGRASESVLHVDAKNVP